MGELVPPSTTSRALVVPEPLKLRPKPKEKVLDEDTYIDALSTIIKRDFYPDLPKLEAQLEWMRAEAVNDVEKMRELQQRMLTSVKRPTTGRATPGQRTPRNATTPAGFETPTAGNATPRNAANATPRTNATPRGNSSAQAQGETAAAPGALNLDVSLDKFVERHTSEDDASFGGIMERQHEKHQEKYDWVENKSNEAALMLIEATKKDETGHFPAVQTWNYTVRNQLMYVPEGQDGQSTTNLMPPPPGPPKAILHRNTRITASPSTATSAAVRKGDRDAVWNLMANASAANAAGSSAAAVALEALRNHREAGNSKVDLADLLGTPRQNPAQSPQVGGYGFVATPSPAPGVDMSPMTTWGRLDGTPLLLDPMDTPLDLTPGPSFKVPDTPRREEIGMRLADKATKAQKLKSAARESAASPYARPTSSSVALSPAGRSLMQRKMGDARKTASIGGLDMQLRASYKSSPSVSSTSKSGSSSKSGGFVTPSPVPSPSPRVTSKTSSSSTPSSSLTDNLLDLNIPPPASPSHHSSSSNSKKGKSITDDLLI